MEAKGEKGTPKKLRKEKKSIGEAKNSVICSKHPPGES